MWECMRQHDLHAGREHETILIDSGGQCGERIYVDWEVGTTQMALETTQAGMTWYKTTISSALSKKSRPSVYSTALATSP